MLYFAYGSNMDLKQIKERCKSSEFKGIALLPDYKLIFPQRSKNRGCNVASVMPETGSEVWGVVYDIPEKEVSNLDKTEGYIEGHEGNSYERRSITVLMEGNKDKKQFVSIYIGIKKSSPGLPDKKYKDLILNGSKYWKLPEYYIKDVLENIVV